MQEIAASTIVARRDVKRFSARKATMPPSASTACASASSGVTITTQAASRPSGKASIRPARASAPLMA
jgi:hypothetical protein